MMFSAGNKLVPERDFIRIAFASAINYFNSLWLNNVFKSQAGMKAVDLDFRRKTLRDFH